jgi:preprotein translocase subunit SecF
MKIFANAAYPFLEWRRKAYIVSAVLIVAGLIAMGANYARTGSWLNYGVDFTGGTLVQVDFSQPTSVEQIRATAAGAGFPQWEITRFGAADEFVIRMPTFEQTVGMDARQRVTQALSRGYQANQFRIVRTEAVGPKVGRELQQRALLAILASFAATLLYLAFRFEWRFGLAAIIATAHDILITLGVLAASQSVISLGTVAAFLTIVGYSLNDTIVVFDRIRENLAKPRTGRSYMEVLNAAINETLSRTVLTGGSSLATLTALFIFGGPVIRNFAWVLILGIVVGTFSSIFVAAPALYEIERRWPRQPKRVRGRMAPSSASRVRSPAA